MAGAGTIRELPRPEPGKADRSGPLKTPRTPGTQVMPNEEMVPHFSADKSFCQDSPGRTGASPPLRRTARGGAGGRSEFMAERFLGGKWEAAAGARRTSAIQREADVLHRRDIENDSEEKQNGGWPRTDNCSSRRLLITAHAHRTRHAVSRGARSCLRKSAAARQRAAAPKLRLTGTKSRSLDSQPSAGDALR